MAEQPKPPDRSELFDLYRIALDEYRFQVNLNWGRTEHWFTLNAAITSAAVALLHLANHAALLLVGGIFFVAAAACTVASHAVIAQHDYYRQARDHKGDVEERLALRDLALTTTPGMGSPRRRRYSLFKLYASLLALLAILNLAGAAYSCWRYTAAQKPAWPTKSA